MRNPYRRLLLIVSVLELFTLSTAWAAKSGKLGVEILGAGTYSMAKSSSQVSSRQGFPGGGFIFNYRLGSKVTLEFGALYLSMVINNGSDQNITMMQGLGGLKFHFGKSFFMDLGGYGNNHLKDPMTVTGRDGGAYGGIGVRIRPTSKVGLVLRIQYDHALTTVLDTYGESITPSQVVGLVGLSFGARKK